MFTKIRLVMSVCAWDTLARFMEYGGGGCVLDNFYRFVRTVQSCAGVYGTVDACVIVSVDVSLQGGREVMHGVIYPPLHRAPRSLDMPFKDICLPSPTPPMIATLTVPKTVISSSGNIVPQNSMQARSLPDSAKWLAAENEAMDSVIGILVIGKMVIGRTDSYLTPGVDAIPAMFVYEPKCTLAKTVERYKARRVVRGSLKNP